MLDDSEREALDARTSSVSNERMMRGLADAIEVLTADRTLMLVIEDLHAADRATAEFLGYLARRRERARLLVLGTYRRAEAVAGDVPFRRVLRELRSRRRCAHLVRDLLSPSDVDDYECGRDFASAAHHLSIGAESALSRAAYQEVLQHTERGLELLQRASARRDPEVEARLSRCAAAARGALSQVGP